MSGATPDILDATIHYVAPGSRINRFFWAPEGRHGTVVSQPVRVQIRNARSAPRPFSADTHGFALVRSPAPAIDVHDREAVKTIYGPHVARLAQNVTGADFVLPMGWELRSSDGRDGMLPPAARVHIDYDTPTARQIAERRYRTARPQGPGYERFILFSLWRSLSPAPQDWPLALCDHESARHDGEIRCVKIDVPRLPIGEEAFAPIEGEDSLGASALFAPSPAHRWWFYPDMTGEEAIFIKFHDSDHGRAWRALHAAFRDETTRGTVPRQSIEYRGCAYFTKK